MKASFSRDEASLILTPEEFGFIFRCVSDRIYSLPEWEAEPRLGMSYEDADALINQLLEAELAARETGNHWMPAKKPSSLTE